MFESNDFFLVDTGVGRHWGFWEMMPIIKIKEQKIF